MFSGVTMSIDVSIWAGSLSMLVGKRPSDRYGKWAQLAIRPRDSIIFDRPLRGNQCPPE